MGARHRPAVPTRARRRLASIVASEPPLEDGCGCGGAPGESKRRATVETDENEMPGHARRGRALSLLG